MTLIYNATFDKNTRKLSFEDKAGNEIYSCTIPERTPTVDDINKPLTFRATQDGSTVKLTRKGYPSGDFQTSRDGGNTWAYYRIDTAITLNTGDEVSFRANSDRTSAQDYDNRFQFKMTGKIEAWHNVMSMYRTNYFAGYKSVVAYAFFGLFSGCTSLTKAPVLPATKLAPSCYFSMFQGCTSLTEAPVLPVTTLASDCYKSMFSGCTSLTKAPELPSTTLAGSCYLNMFNGCTSLTEAPVLPATTLASSCYNGMFRGCTSLTEAPVLPVTTLADHCYPEMFSGCTSLTKAPELPATTLAGSCYASMFSGCTSLTEAPVLPATTLAGSCYQYMFNGCTSLTKAPELPATTLASGCYSNMFNGCRSLNEVRCKISSTISAEDISSTYAKSWLSGVSSTGTFYTNADANWPSGVSGIPTGWTRVNEVAKDDITKPLTFKATQDGSTVKLTKTGSPTGSFQTSTDGGSTWTDYTIGTDITLNTGDEVSFRAKSDRTSAQNFHNRFDFTMKGKIEAWHNVMSLYRTNDFATYESVVGSAFESLFRDCTSLTKAPVLPATTLAPSCYSDMFRGCSSLTKAPELPATTLADYCYYSMFVGCGSLNEVRCQMPSTISAEDVSKYTGSVSEAWLYGVASTGTFYTNADADWPTGPSGIPYGWTRVNESTPTVDDINKPLTFRATQDGSTVTLKKNGSIYGDFQTSRDGGNTWTDYTLNTAISLNTGEEVSFRAKADRSAQREGDYIYFEMTGKIEAWHNVMSMIFTNDFPTYKATVSYAFNRMFGNCTSLTKAPVLPAISLSKYCYLYMFSGCTSLTKAPELPATTLAQNCYTYMFMNCTSLTKTPELPATTLADYCYTHMFSGCQSLKEVRISATNTASYSLGDWLRGVSATGDFYCDPNATIFPSGSASGIPANWTRHALADYPVTP